MFPKLWYWNPVARHQITRAMFFGGEWKMSTPKASNYYESYAARAPLIICNEIKSLAALNRTEWQQRNFFPFVTQKKNDWNPLMCNLIIPGESLILSIAIALSTPSSIRRVVWSTNEKYYIPLRVVNLSHVRQWAWGKFFFNSSLGWYSPRTRHHLHIRCGKWSRQWCHRVNGLEGSERVVQNCKLW